MIAGSISLGLASTSLGAFATARAAGGRLFAMMAREPLVDTDAKGGLEPELVQGAVELRGVSFAYVSLHPFGVLFVGLGGGGA